MSNIRETIENAVPVAAAQFPVEINRVVDALLEREWDLMERIVDQVTEQFEVPAEAVRGRLASLGAEVRPEPEPVNGVSVDTRLASLEAKVDALVRLASDRLNVSI